MAGCAAELFQRFPIPAVGKRALRATSKPLPLTGQLVKIGPKSRRVIQLRCTVTATLPTSAPTR
jgi:hypothetical protein